MIVAWPDLAPFVVLALFGALHCVGMCGGFAIAVTASGGSERHSQWTSFASYIAGKSIAYGALGCAVATASQLAVGAGALVVPGEELAALGVARALVSWLCGVALIASGAAIVLRTRISELPLFPLRGARGLFSLVRQLPGAAGAFGTGLITGLLPCGLSWSALVLAATVSPATALVGLSAFGLATAPALLAASGGWLVIPMAWRARLTRATGPLLIVFGALTIARASPEVVPAPLARVLPQCCAPAADVTTRNSSIAADE